MKDDTKLVDELLEKIKVSKTDSETIRNSVKNNIDKTLQKIINKE